MFSMSSQNTFGKVRLNDKVESRVRGDLYARFGGECLETYHCNKWQGAGCLAYGQHHIVRSCFFRNGRKRPAQILPSAHNLIHTAAGFLCTSPRNLLLRD